MSLLGLHSEVRRPLQKKIIIEANTEANPRIQAQDEETCIKAPSNKEAYAQAQAHPEAKALWSPQAYTESDLGVPFRLQSSSNVLGIGSI